MASLANHVSLVITQDSVGIARAGFGVPLILGMKADAFAERSRVYDSLGAVGDDFAVDTAEYEAASAIFGQSPHPSSLRIGRPTTSPTMVRTLAVQTAAKNSHVYTVGVEGEGEFDPVNVTYTSDSGATVAEIIAGLTTALNAVVGKNYTAVDTASTSIVVTGSAAGKFFSLQVNPSDLSNLESTADPGMAADLAAINLESSAWYALTTLVNSNAAVLAAAGWISANGKVYGATTADTGSVTAGAGNSDTIDDLKTLGYDRVWGSYHDVPAQHFNSAWQGDVLPIDPGGETWKWKRLTGISAPTMTATHRSNLIAKNGNSYEEVAGQSMTFEGTMADGSFIDTRRGLDWIDDDMAKGVYGALLGPSKIPYTDRGAAIIAAEVRASLRRAEVAGIIAEGWEVTIPSTADQSTSDRALRILRNVRFSATLAGAIHKVFIAGVVSV